MPARRRPPPPPSEDGASSDEGAPLSLAQYQAMRDFEATPEPAGATVDLGPQDQPLTFVIQKHRATRLHYDLRLEVDGVMPSWPIPRGPSTDTSERRLAVMTEPHPMDYATFEGVIGRGQYGAGEVIVWDRGTYSPDELGTLHFEDRAEANRQMREQIANGKVSVTFRGHRMKGSWALVKTNQAPDSWLALKHKDDAATGVDLAETFDDSVICGLTIGDLQAGRLVPETREIEPLLAVDLPGAKRAPFLEGVEPMAATQTAKPFDRAGWIFEPKIDGVRVLITIQDGKARLTSRRGLDMTAQYPALVASLAKQPANTLILDGEIAALDANGVPSFELLQQRINLTDATEIRSFDRSLPVVCYVFDVLYLDSVDVRRVPLMARKHLLQRTLMPTPWVHLMDYSEGNGVQAYDGAVAIGLEGLVAKRADSRYESGTRSQAWVKVKSRLTNEFVVTGYTPGLNSRSSTFGALVIATREDDGRLVSVGRVGSGFTEAMLKSLKKRLDGMRVEASPMAVPPPASEHVTHVRPDLVVEVEYAMMTSDGNLRAPVFLRLREDKAPTQVRTLHLVPPPDGIEASPPPVVDAVPGLAEQVASVLKQLDGVAKARTIEVAGARIALTNLDKVMWPPHHGQRALTKRDLLVYYAKMAHVLIPHLRNRPLTMTRYPNGLEGHSFYQKHVDSPPPFVETVHVYTETERGNQEFVVVNNLPTLLWLAQFADIALHTSLARVDPEPDGHHLGRVFTDSKANVEASLLNYPDFILFDFDPYIYRGDEGKGAEPELNRPAYEETVRMAQALKALLDSAHLSSFVKTSGATGLHVYVPVVRQYDYQFVRDMAMTVGGALVAQHPREVTLEWNIEKRRGMVFLDGNQNARIKNLAAPYSPRAKPGGPVSMPLRWDELDRVFPTDFTILTAPDRIARVGDLWAHILDAKHNLVALTGGT
ncbi:MAG: ATP-dependent DNA ligase [Dehalococcoidia bacterium]|nr:MAG: ATP-dependent DNA ligase [Dehalococcoidia bacterium]